VDPNLLWNRLSGLFIKPDRLESLSYKPQKLDLLRLAYHRCNPGRLAKMNVCLPPYQWIEELVNVSTIPIYEKERCPHQKAR
jgi:hypothetical protein